MMTDEMKILVQSLREHAKWAEGNKQETPVNLSIDLSAAAALIELLSTEVSFAYALKGVCKAMLADLNKQKEQVKRMEDAIKEKDKLLCEMTSEMEAWRTRAMCAGMD